jgi:hypothetical protein
MAHQVPLVDALKPPSNCNSTRAVRNGGPNSFSRQEPRGNTFPLHPDEKSPVREEVHRALDK